MLKAQSSTELVTDNSDSTDVSNEGSLSQLRTQGGSQDALFPPRPREGRAHARARADLAGSLNE
eukprot:5729194-Prymnesium_polylepis.1